ncbi:MAG: hypothetical protein K0Q83_2526 [Deltaproteobacteria bacterium]|jgi:hypothetical protein|nr:hypothetical protein [Deltaproteobacteria bacterium]
MTKLRKWWSDFGEDTLLFSAIIGLVLGLYLLVAYLFIRAI